MPKGSKGEVEICATLVAGFDSATESEMRAADDVTACDLMVDAAGPSVAPAAAMVAADPA